MQGYVWDIYLSLYKTSCTRATKSKLFCRSFALSLYKTSFGSAVSRPVKLRFPALPLHSPRIVFVNDVSLRRQYTDGDFLQAALQFLIQLLQR